MRRIAWTPRLIVPLVGLTIGILLGMEIKGFIDDLRVLTTHTAGAGSPKAAHPH
jgi:hypothetical protein